MKYLIEVTIEDEHGDIEIKNSILVPGTKRPPDQYLWFKDLVRAIKSKKGLFYSDDEEMKDLYPEFTWEDFTELYSYLPFVDQWCTIKSFNIYTIIDEETL